MAVCLSLSPLFHLVYLSVESTHAYILLLYIPRSYYKKSALSFLGQLMMWCTCFLLSPIIYHSLLSHFGIHIRRIYLYLLCCIHLFHNRDTRGLSFFVQLCLSAHCISHAQILIFYLLRQMLPLHARSIVSHTHGEKISFQLSS